MNSLYGILILFPMRLLAQSDTLIIPLSPPVTNPLKPIELREIPYTYTTHTTTTIRGHTTTTSSTRTGIHRIYSYDGVDVDNPQRELWRYLDAAKDPNVAEQHHQYTAMVAYQEKMGTIGLALMVPGIVMLFAGGSKARDYQNALKQQKSTAVSQITTPVQTAPNLNNCSVWTGSGNHWTCQSGPYSGQTVTTSPFATATMPVTPVVQSSASSPVEMSNGSGLIIGGALFMVAGAITIGAGIGSQESAFLKAIQYYNRAIKQKFSWELQPSYQYGTTGIRLVGHF